MLCNERTRLTRSYFGRSGEAELSARPRSKLTAKGF